MDNSIKSPTASLAQGGTWAQQVVGRISESANLLSPSIPLTSTRGQTEPTPYLTAIRQAQPRDRGLWLRAFDDIPVLTPTERWVLVDRIRAADESWDHERIAEAIQETMVDIWRRLGTGLSEESIRAIVARLSRGFRSPWIVPVEELHPMMGICLIDETQGPTDAFKDLALQQLTAMVASDVERENTLAITRAKAGERGQKLTFIVTQTSTSGDTGPAGGAGIEGLPYMLNVIGFPAGEATYGQIGQMLRLHDNVSSIPMTEAFSAIQESMKAGNNESYRTAIQEAIRSVLGDIVERYGMEIVVQAGSFNSVNPARVDGQTIYHVTAAIIAEAKGLAPEGIDEVVPSGNFGHALSVVLARRILGEGGIHTIIASTNENDAIYRLIRDGRYRKADSEVSSPSVSMIIRYGSNVERLLAYVLGAERTREVMEVFESGGEVVLSPNEHDRIESLGLGTSRVTVAEELGTIRQVWLRRGRLICPHTANAYYSALQLRDTVGATGRNIFISETASPWKFLAAVATALSCEDERDMPARYAELRRLETTREGVQTLIEMICTAYVQAGRTFRDDMIPEDLRSIYTEGFTLPPVESASRFAAITIDRVRAYADVFAGQVRSAFERV